MAKPSFKDHGVHLHHHLNAGLTAHAANPQVQAKRGLSISKRKGERLGASGSSDGSTSKLRARTRGPICP